MKYTRQLRVNASLTDSQANLSALGLFQVVQDVVTELMGELQIDGITSRREYNATWVVVKNRIKIFKPVAWNADGFSVEGFVSSVKHATLTLDVAVKNASGAPCSYARVELCALDLDTGRIRKTDTVGVGAHITEEQPLMDVVFTRFDGSGLDEIEKVRVRYTNIDMVGHTNNVEYMRFILNTYTVAQMRTRPIKEIEAVYVNQSFEGDVLSVCKGSEGDKDIVFLKKDGKPVIKCEIIF